MRNASSLSRLSWVMEIKELEKWYDDDDDDDDGSECYDDGDDVSM